MNAITMVKQLRRLREELEEGTNEPVHHLEAPAVMLLGDVATVLGLSSEQRREVLGDDAARYLDRWEAAPIKPTGPVGGRAGR